MKETLTRCLQFSINQEDQISITIELIEKSND